MCRYAIVCAGMLLYVQVYALHLHSCSCEVKFVQECVVARLWEVVRFDFLLPHH